MAYGIGRAQKTEKKTETNSKTPLIRLQHLQSLHIVMTIRMKTLTSLVKKN